VAAPSPLALPALHSWVNAHGERAPHLPPHIERRQAPGRTGQRGRAGGVVHRAAAAWVFPLRRPGLARAPPPQPLIAGPCAQTILRFEAQPKTLGPAQSLGAHTPLNRAGNWPTIKCAQGPAVRPLPRPPTLQVHVLASYCRVQAGAAGRAPSREPAYSAPSGPCAGGCCSKLVISISIDDERLASARPRRCSRLERSSAWPARPAAQPHTSHRRALPCRALQRRARSRAGSAGPLRGRGRGRSARRGARAADGLARARLRRVRAAWRVAAAWQPRLPARASPEASLKLSVLRAGGACAPGSQAPARARRAPHPA